MNTIKNHEPDGNRYIKSDVLYIGVGSVPLEEEGGRIVHHCRDYYEYDPITKEYTLTSFYDSVNKKWIDV